MWLWFEHYAATCTMIIVQSCLGVTAALYFWLDQQLQHLFTMLLCKMRQQCIAKLTSQLMEGVGTVPFSPSFAVFSYLMQESVFQHASFKVKTAFRCFLVHFQQHSLPHWKICNRLERACLAFIKIKKESLHKIKLAHNLGHVNRFSRNAHDHSTHKANYSLTPTQAQMREKSLAHFPSTLLFPWSFKPCFYAKHPDENCMKKLERKVKWH